MATRSTTPADDADVATTFFAEHVPQLDVGHFASMWHILGIAHLLATDLDRIAGQHSLSGADLLLLGTLRVAGGAPLRATDLAQKMHVSQAVFSTRIVKLEAAGLIRRERSSTDKRVANLLLTADGKDLADVAIGDIAAYGTFAAAHRCLDDDQRVGTDRALAQLHDELYRRTCVTHRG